MMQQHTNCDISPSCVDLRDTFAAAALTGLLAKSIAPEQAISQYVRIAGEYADAMLRERERTNHDAAPAAKACTDSASCGRGCDGTHKPVTLPAVGAGDIPDSRTRDIVTRLRRWCHAVDAESAQDLMDEAATEIEVQRACTSAARDEVERLRLSESEIDALEYVVEEGRIASLDDYGILRSLLVRVRPEWEAR